MNLDEFLLQPQIYSTHGSDTLLDLLEKHWIKNESSGTGTYYIISGFGNYNGGVRFYDHFENHIQNGGNVRALFGGSTSQRLTSLQLGEALVSCGADVNVINRKHIMHAKCYGYKSETQQSLIVTSGNFTGPGISQNIEAALSVSDETLKRMGFDWDEMFEACLNNSENIYNPLLPVNESIEWKLLYNEIRGKTEAVVDESEETTMLLLLSHADTARIAAEPGSSAGLGSQYFWLSKDALDFFPALNIPNVRGLKPTHSTVVKVKFLDINVEEEVRVTFEAGNNLDFRLGTGPLRYTRVAGPSDIAAITRRKNAYYELKIYKRSDPLYQILSKSMVKFIGHQGKRYGYIPNSTYDNIVRP